jgi:cation/acetate symporter
VFVAAPMRRSGALTVPDFAEARLASRALRRLAAFAVLVIGLLYLVPQFRTAGLVLSVVSGAPYWVGVLLAGVLVSTTLALGGMRAATYVQAFQFCLKLVLFIVPAVWLVLAAGPAVRQSAVHPVEFTEFAGDTRVQFRVAVTLEIEQPTLVHRPDGTSFVLTAGSHTQPAGSVLIFPSGSPVPKVDGKPRPGSPGWERPLVAGEHPVLASLAVLVATMLGTMGLPHVIVRFHTSPDGRSARRTAAITVGLLGVFYLFPGVYGVLGRALLPQLYLTGATDTVVVALPSQVNTGWPGSMFTAMLTAGAFAAFFATSLGLLLVVSSAVAHDLIPSNLQRLRVTVFWAAAIVVLLALPSAHLAAGVLVTWGFTVAASTFSPLLVLGIWWPRLTKAGALSGVAAGLTASAGAIALTLFGPPLSGVAALLVAQPAPWSVPLAFLTMVVVSLRGHPPAWATSAMLQLHLPDNPPATITRH